MTMSGACAPSDRPARRDLYSMEAPARRSGHVFELVERRAMQVRDDVPGAVALERLRVVARVGAVLGGPRLERQERLAVAARDALGHARRGEAREILRVGVVEELVAA